MTTEGKLTPVRVSIWPEYAAADEGRCSKGSTWNDPTDPTISCVFDGVDPVQQFTVQTSFGPKIMDIPPEGSSNWYGVFKLFHAMDLTSENDESGQSHIRCPKIEGDVWKYQAKKLFAFARYTEPPPYATAGGHTEEDSTIRLFHAPKALRSSDTSVP